jgi:hypothetical protein
VANHRQPRGEILTKPSNAPQGGRRSFW